MSTDPTLSQGGPQRRRSQELSLHPGQPPAQVPGYELDHLLGEGAYGEVWVGTEKNTGRRVAVKFYAHRGGLDWSLLSREVEKLAFLFADRHVVQLIGVGWDADPPYYVMEYLEHGSLAERLQNGPLPVAEAVELFRDIAVGLVHAHGKGVLHCDLKPANILLDQDGKPRLADFGQSRLSHEQVPTLGTLFYMAPEQADLKAIPDARWDVYALGALLYCTLTGSPPYRNAEDVDLLDRTVDLDERLAVYRRMIRKSPPPAEHRQTAGVDRALAAIVDRCLAPDPAKRYPNVQAVLDALDARAARRALRPMMVLGVAGPGLLLLVVSVFAWQGFSIALRRSEEALTVRALENNRLTAQYVAGIASKELQRRCDAVEEVASSERLRKALADTVAKPELQELLRQLSPQSGSKGSGAALEPLQRFREHADRRRLQEEFEAILPFWMRPPQKEGAEEADEVASWFFCDANGVSTVRVPQSQTLGRNYAWRSFFHGGDRDLEPGQRPPPGQRLKTTKLSAVFQSQASHRWIVAVSTPVWAQEPGEPEGSKKFLGVVALTVRVNRFVHLKGDENQFAVLVDLRPGNHTGMILQHPLFDKPLESNKPLLDRFEKPRFRLTDEHLPVHEDVQRNYRDPLATDDEGQAYNKHWLARIEPVSVSGADAGWGVIVQESYETAIGQALGNLRSKLLGYGLAALAMVVLVLVSLWGLAFRLLGETGLLRGTGLPNSATERPRQPLTQRGPTETQRGDVARELDKPGPEKEG